MQPWMIAAAIAGGYLLGSIPFGLILTSAAGLGDIRQIGSGNIGATNVLRTGRRDLALATLLTDAGKGALAVLLAWLHFRFLEAGETRALMCLAGGAAFFGHLFSVFLKFKGGKGMATFLGVLLAINWMAGLLACAVWLAVAFVFRYSSLASLSVAALSPLLVLVSDRPRDEFESVYLALFMAILVFIKHHANIRRLMKGEEPKIGAKKA